MLLSHRSPFLVFQEFLSPLHCENIVDDLDLTVPNEDVNGTPQKMVMHHDRLETQIYEKFLDIIPNIEAHFNVEHRATSEIDFTWIPQGSPQGEPVCENSTLLGNSKKTWVKVRDRDFTCVLFLSQYCNSPDFDSLYEAYGGKLEFPTWGFGFNPEIGTMIVYPSAPNFINITSPVHVGDLVIVKFHIATANQFIFNPRDFPGDYKTWFQHIP